MPRKQVGMIDATLVARVDAARAPLGQTRRVWVERALEAALGGATARAPEKGTASRGAGTLEGASSPAPAQVPAPPRTPRPARDATSPEPIVGRLVDTATGHETPVSRPATKQELDMQRQLKMNANKKGSKA